MNQEPRTKNRLTTILESILFVASKPLAIRDIAKSTGEKEASIREALDTVKERYNRKDSGIQILEIGDTVQMGTNPACAQGISAFITDEISEELTRAQLETLTIVSYRGPITRAELEQIRGVNCAVIIRNLLMRGLIEEKEREHEMFPVYMLSMEAIQHLDIRSPKELPEYEILSVHEHIEALLQEKDSTSPQARKESFVEEE